MKPPRNHVIDVARAASIIVVVVYHGLLYQIDLTSEGITVEPWAAPTVVYPLTWILMIMPLFFVAGGFANSVTIDRLRGTPHPYATYLRERGRRLTGPTLLFVTTSAVISTLGAAIAGTADARVMSQRFMILLWFLAVYLVIIAVAPLMVKLQDWAGVWPLVALWILGLVVDGFAFGDGRLGLLDLNYLIVWLGVHQLGIAYNRGWFRKGPVWIPWLSIVGGLALVAFLVLSAGYPPSAVAFADIPVANVQPPTTAMAALAVSHCGVLALIERSGYLTHLSERASRALAVVNALMVTTYLWHLLGIIGAGILLVGLSCLLPAAQPWLLHQLTIAVVGLLITSVLVPQVAKLEARLIPAPHGPVRARQVGAAYATLVLGVIAVWSRGAVFLPSAPASLTAVVLVWVGAALMRHAVGAPPLLRTVAK